MIDLDDLKLAALVLTAFTVAAAFVVLPDRVRKDRAYCTQTGNLQFDVVGANTKKPFVSMKDGKISGPDKVSGKPIGDNWSSSASFDVDLNDNTCFVGGAIGGYNYKLIR